MTILMKTTVLTSIACVSFLMLSGPAMASEAVPANYAQVKAALGYADAIDQLDANDEIARKALQLKADESVPALKMLFAENTDDGHRTAIIGIFNHVKTSQAEVASFVADQLKNSAEFASTVSPMQDQTWVRIAFRLLLKIDPATAGQVSRQALASSTNYCAQWESLKIFEQVGKKEDVILLYSYANRRFPDPEERLPHELTDEAKRIAEIINNR